MLLDCMACAWERDHVPCLLQIPFCNNAKLGPCFFQPIQLETSPDCVETAAMHIIEPEQSSIADSRVCAMHDRDPIHTMLYDSNGLLISANKAAMTAFHIDTPGK